jgi:hypothetical protein
VSAPGGGAAFPTLGDAYMQVADGSWQPKSAYGMEGEPGMLLRDYFAAAALPHLMAHLNVRGCAARAYEMADAMLAAREVKP